MLSDQQLQYFKEEYNGHKVIYVRFSDEDFIFKTLTVKEYELIMKTYQDQFKQETAICNMACIYPEGYEFSECEYGVFPSVMAGYIKKLSSFDTVDDIFNEYYMAKESVNLYQQCLDLIKAFIGDYTYEEMEDWTWQKLMDMTVRAENIAKMKGYDFHLERNEEESNAQTQTIHNPEDVQMALNNKINPLIFFKEELEKEKEADNNMVDVPFILGASAWKNEEIMNAFREQKAKQRQIT